MSEPITPKANRRIIDGEVINNNTAEKPAPKKLKSKEKVPSNHNSSAGIWKKIKQGLLLFGVVILVLIILFLMNNQKNQNWQIESINLLQAQVANLSKESRTLTENNESLKETLIEQEANQKIMGDLLTLLEARQEAMQDELIILEDNQPIITKSDLNALGFKLGVVETELAALAESYSKKIENLAKEFQLGLKQGLDNTTDLAADLSTPEIRQDLEEKLAEMAVKIADLFAFKSLADEQSLKKDSAIEDNIAFKALPQPYFLAEMKIKQWVLDINSQWVIIGNVEQTIEQLLAFEQALGLSDMPNKMTLIRYIGEDLNQLKQIEKVPVESVAQNILELKNWALSLEHKGTTLNAKDQSHILDSEKELTSGERLQEALTGLFSIQKRETPESLSLVEKILLEEVVDQRMLLLVDKISWAVMIESEQHLSRSIDAIKAFLLEFYDLSGKENEKIQKLSAVNVKFSNVRQPLNIMNAL